MRHRRAAVLLVLTTAIVVWAALITLAVIAAHLAGAD